YSPDGDYHDLPSFPTRRSSDLVGAELGLCTNPEFLKEGSAIEDTFHPDKLVIGSIDTESAGCLKRLYRAFYGDDVPPTIETTPEDRKSTRLNSSHVSISYAVFC